MNKRGVWNKKGEGGQMSQMNKRGVWNKRGEGGKMSQNIKKLKDGEHICLGLEREILK